MLTEDQKAVIFHMANYSGFDFASMPDGVTTITDLVADEMSFTKARVTEIMHELLVMTKE